MTTNECKRIRREIDEADLNKQLSNAAADHLRLCSECRTFHAEQRALQELMASLDPVAAPSDFDFKLRARLAREKSHMRNAASSGNFSIARPIAAVALVMLIAAAGVVVVRNWLASRNVPTSSALNVPPRSESSSGQAETKNPRVPDGSTKENVSAAVQNSGEVSRNNSISTQRNTVSSKNNAPRNSFALVRKVERTATREFSGSPAPLVESEQNRDSGSVVLVPLDARALKISIDNGRGSTRTISLPTVSFGSQRLMARESFMPAVSPSKGVW